MPDLRSRLGSGGDSEGGSEVSHFKRHRTDRGAAEVDDDDDDDDGPAAVFDLRDKIVAGDEKPSGVFSYAAAKRDLHGAAAAPADPVDEPTS